MNPTEGPSPDDVTEVVRGFEIVRWDPYARTWEMIGKFRNDDLALRQAIADMKWLQDRHPKQLYRINALVSHSPPRPVEESVNDTAAATENTPSEQVTAVTEGADGQLDSTD